MQYSGQLLCGASGLGCLAFMIVGAGKGQLRHVLQLLWPQLASGLPLLLWLVMFVWHVHFVMLEVS
jgi:hypothetical protein